MRIVWIDRVAVQPLRQAMPLVIQSRVDGGIRGFGICVNVELARAFMVIKDVRKNREHKHCEHDSEDHCRNDQDIFHLCTNVVKSDLQNYKAENDLRL